MLVMSRFSCRTKTVCVKQLKLGTKKVNGNLFMSNSSALSYFESLYKSPMQDWT